MGLFVAKTTYKTDNTNSTAKGGNPTPFIDATTAMNAFDESRKWLRPYFDPIDELERIARNRPSSKIDPNLPRVTDGTMAATVQEQPKRIIQQVPTGAVTCKMYPEYAAIADIVLTERLIPLYARNGDMLQKSWNMLGKAMTYGLQTSYTFLTYRNGELHTDFVLPYVKDVIIEKGKVFAPDSNIGFMRSWYQKRDIQAIIEREKYLSANIKGYQPGWDLQMLANFMSAGAKAKSAEQQTPAEKEKGGETGGFEVVHAFQTGKGAEFYSFSPNFENGRPFRTKVTNDPRGKMPLDFLYCNVDLSNPLGRGQVELSGGIQNLIDQQMQMFQFMTTLMMGPPLQVWGDVDRTTIKYRPNAIWDMGANQNSLVKPIDLDNFAIQNFGNNYSLLKSQIYNLNNNQDHSISSESGNPAQSKTQAGVQASEQRLSISDNYLRKQYESWFSRQSETSLNIFFSEMQGNDKIELGPEQIDRLKSGAAAKFIKNNKLIVNYKEINNVAFEFIVDPDSSREADNVDQQAKLQEILAEVNQAGPVLSYYLGQDGKKLNIGELYKQRFQRMGLKNLDTILTDMTAEEAQAAKQAPFPIIDKPQIRINSADLSPEALIAALQAGGVNVNPQSAMGASAQAQLDYQVEMLKAQAQAQSLAAGQNQGADPNELALKHRELDLKQQQLDQATDQHATQTAIDVAKMAHEHTLGMVQALTPAEGTGEQTPPGQTSPTQKDVHQPAQPQQQQLPQDDGPLSQQEQQVAVALMHRGFSEGDVEQAIVLARQGMPLDQVVQTLGAKYAAAQ